MKNPVNFSKTVRKTFSGNQSECRSPTNNETGKKKNKFKYFAHLAGALFLFSSPCWATVTLGTYGATGASGWTTFTQDGGGVKRWVDPVSGLDTNNGILVGQTEGGVVGNGAWQTLTHAVTQFNNGDTGRIKNYKDNWLLLKKGTTFTADSLDGIARSGQDAQHPLVIGAYDPANPTVVNPSTGGARPIVKVPLAGAVSGVSFGQGGGDFFAIVGIDFDAYQRNPDDAANFTPGITPITGINLSNPITWGLIEDCRLQHFTVGINVPAANWQNTALVIRRNVVAFGFPTTVPGNGQGIEIASVTNLTLEENFVDHNTWSESSYFTGATVSVSAASPGVVTWTGNKLWNGAMIHFSSGAANGISNNTEYIVANLSGSTFTLTDDAGTPINTTGTSTPVLVWDVPGLAERGFNHNDYLQGYSPDAETTGNINDTVGGFSSGPHTVRGNIFSRNSISDPFRVAGTFTDNLSVNNPTPWSIFNGINFSSSVTNNVFLEAVNALYSGSYGWGMSWTTFYAFDYYNLGSGVFSGNIFSNSQATDGFGVKLDYGTNGWTVSNNILFNWKTNLTVGPSPPYTTAAFEGLTGTPFSYGAISGTYPNATGSIVSYGTVTGTFAAATGGITGFGAFTGGPFDDGQYTVTISHVGGGGGQAVITVSGGVVTSAVAVPANYGTVAKIGDAVTCLLPQSGTLVTATSSVTQLIVQQLALSGGTGINAAADFTLNSSSQVTSVKPNANSISAVGYKVGNSLSGTLGGTPFTVPVSSIRTGGIALTGGTGTGAQLMAVVGAGGTVTKTYIGALVNPLNGNSVTDTTTIGSGYTNGDTLSGTLGGTAFSVQVASVGTNTLTNNASDPSGLNSAGYPAPTRTIETYVTSLGLGTTAADFYAAANANAKYNWNPALTANNGVNPYIRAGFGIGTTAGSRSWIGRF